MVHRTKWVETTHGAEPGDTQKECQKAVGHWTPSSHLDEVQMGTLELGALLGSFEGDDVGGLVHVANNARAKGDVGVAVIPRCVAANVTTKGSIPGGVSMWALVRSPSLPCESGSTRRRHRSTCGARLSRARGTTGLRGWWSAWRRWSHANVSRILIFVQWPCRAETGEPFLMWRTTEGDACS